VPNETRTNNKILFIIPAAYVLLKLPQNIYLAVTQFIDRRFNNPQLNYFTLGFFFLNHSINFILYALARYLQYMKIYHLSIKKTFSKLFLTFYNSYYSIFNSNCFDHYFQLIRQIKYFPPQYPSFSYQQFQPNISTNIFPPLGSSIFLRTYFKFNTTNKGE